MKSRQLFVLSAFLLALAVTTLFTSFHGSVTLTGAAPLAASALDICGSAKGGWALVAVLMMIASLIVFIVAVVRAFAYESKSTV